MVEENNKEKEISPIERAEQAAARLEAANKKYEELIAHKVIAGESEAGSGDSEEKPKETTPSEYAKEVLAGKHNDAERKKP